MKNLIIPTLSLLTLLALSNCDKINPPYTKGSSQVDTTECPVPTFPVKNTHHKVVMMEEYTGHSCVNCPTAAVVADTMENQHGDSLVVISIHAGYFAEIESPNYLLNLSCATGEALYSHYGITNNPAAMFNRKSIGGSRIFETYSSWPAIFIQAKDTVPLLDMQIINNYNESEKKVCIHIQTEYLATISRPLKLAVYVTEDSIVGYQKNNNSAVGPVPEISNYVFMNVLRAAVNTTWGDNLTTTTTAIGTKKISNYKLLIDPLWNDDHCNIIAFVYYADTEEILAAVKAKVK